MSSSPDGDLLLPPIESLPPTELVNPASIGIDVKGAAEIVEIIQREDRVAWEAVTRARADVVWAVETVAAAFAAGGRLIYIGAGTSGRLGVLDAAECPPTFGVSPDLVRGVIAGGERALRESVEGAEDSPAAGATDLAECWAGARDVVCGIAASGTTPYVWGALEEASRRDATTILITCNPRWDDDVAHAGLVDRSIVLDVGPEIIAGSSRLKAGTATKLVLNTISTAAMIRVGKVYDNLMVDLTPVNAKLKRRSVGLVCRIAQTNSVRAVELLAEAHGEVKTAIVMARGVSAARARELIAANSGNLRRTLEAVARELA